MYLSPKNHFIKNNKKKEEEINMERISKELIDKGIDKNVITFGMEDDTLTAYIGDYWFFISQEHNKTENDYTKEELINLIYEAINGKPINNDEEDEATECLYYKAILEEDLM